MMISVKIKILKRLFNIQGSAILLPVLVTVALGVAVSSMNALIAQNNLRRINDRLTDLISFPARELAAWQSYYLPGAPVGSADAQGRYQVGLELDSSVNLPGGLDAAVPAGYVEGTPLNIAQTLQADQGKLIYSRISSENFRYQPTQNIGGINKSCGYLKITGKDTGFQLCLNRTAPPPICPPGICTTEIQTCIQYTEPKTPILIHDEAELLAIQSGNHYELANDIAMTGGAQVTALDLSGVIINGKNYKLTNLISRDENQFLLGLVRNLDCTLIKDLTIQGGAVPSIIQTGGFLAQTINNTALINLNLSQGSFNYRYSGTTPVIYAGGLVGVATDSIFNKVSVGVSIGDVGTAGVNGPNILGGICGRLNGVKSRMSEVNFSGSISVRVETGGIVGALRGGEISKATMSGTLEMPTGSNDNVGGIVGTFSGGAIRESNFTGTITNGAYVGGLAANATTSLGEIIVEKSVSSGTVIGGSIVGGLFGLVSISSSKKFELFKTQSSANLATGSVNSAIKGGIIGSLVASNSLGVFKDVYSQGTINHTGTFGHIGGLMGAMVAHVNGSVTFQNCLANTTMTCAGCTNLQGVIGTIGTGFPVNGIVSSNCFFNRDLVLTNSFPSKFTAKTTAELQNQATYTGWDFSMIWTLAPGPFPSFIQP